MKKVEKREIEQLNTINTGDIDFKGNQKIRQEEENKKIQQKKSDQNWSIFIGTFICLVTIALILSYSKTENAQSSCEIDNDTNYCIEHL